MAKPVDGNTVRVHYTGTLEDGSTFDSSRGGEPLEFVMGQGQLINGFETAVAGLEPGESVTSTFPQEEGYGERDARMIMDVPRSSMPPEMELEAGMILNGEGPNGEVSRFTVLSFDDENVKLDANHPLAGKTLTFEIELLEIA